MVARTVQFPLTLPDDPQQRRACTHRLEESLGRHRGIQRVGVKQPAPATSVLELAYDPDTLSLSQIRSTVTQAGAKWHTQIAQLLLPIQGLVSPRRESVVETVLNRLPGVTAVASFASQTIRVEFDRESCSLPEIVRQLDRLGIGVLPPRTACERKDRVESHLERWFRLAVDYPALSTACLGAALLLAATIVRVIGGPPPLRLALIFTSYGLCGWSTAINTFRVLRRFHFDVDVLMFAAAIGAASLGNFEEGGLLLLLFALGNAGEQLAVGKAKQAIHALTRLAPKTATRIEGDTQREVPVEELQVGDHIRIPSHQQISADAEVLEGSSAVDQSAITGESVPVEKTAGDMLFAGTMNGPGAMIAAVTRCTQDNTLSKLIRLVQEAQTTKSPTQLLADRVERFYVPFVLLATACLIFIPPIFGVVPAQENHALWAGWFYQAMAFLTAASPCALAIGTPAAVLSGIGRAARVGVLIKGGVHLENLGRVRAIAFDKTGTLTQGRPVVTEVIPTESSFDGKGLLALAAAVERGSQHPLAQAIVDYAAAGDVAIPAAHDIQQTSSLGITGRVDGRRLAIGSPAMLTHLDEYRDVQRRIEQARQTGQTVVVIAEGERPLGLILLADQPRASAAGMLKKLPGLGIKDTIMLTGDHAAAAQGIADRIGIQTVLANLLPEEKLQRVEQLDQEHGGVAMVGDGVNDAPAMARATVGIAIGGATGGGSDAALETADVVLLTDDLGRLPEAIGLSRFARRIIAENLLIALGTIAVLAPLAALGFAPIVAAVFFHEGSTVVVVLNALRLLGYRVPD